MIKKRILFIEHVLLIPVFLIVCVFIIILFLRRAVVISQQYHPIYGVNVEMSQILPSSPHYVKNSNGEDLIDIASNLGITMFRITNATAGNKQSAMYTKEQWDEVLDKMNKKGIKALILIESPTVYTKNISQAYLPFVQKYLLKNDILANSDIYGVDLYNEPAINNPNNIIRLNTAAKIIKKKYPGIKLTVGWWAVDTFQTDSSGNEIYKWDDYSAGKTVDSFIDFYSLHMYGFDQKMFGIYPDAELLTVQFVAKVKNGLQTKKPLFIEEFGASNGETVSDRGTNGSPQLQASVYTGVYQAINRMHERQIMGTAAFQLYPRTKAPDPWAIVKDQGNYVYPAAYTLQKFATKNPAW